MKNEKKIRVAIITNILTNYRQGFYDRLLRRDDIHVTVYCQNYIPGMNFISVHEQYPDNVKIVKYLSAKREQIAWQFLPWNKILFLYDVVFVSGNPRVLSDVLLATFLRLINKKVVLWTMAHSYRGNKFTEGLRLLWTRIFPLIFVYTDKEVEFLRNRGFKKQYILGMNNGLDQKKIEQAISSWTEKKLHEWVVTKGFENRVIILSSARLERKNKFELVLRAIPGIAEQIPNILWCLIGGGEEEKKLRETAENLEITQYVFFVGTLYDEEQLAAYFLSSQLFIHPAAIGLGMMHAFGYGLPVIIHGQAHLHGPEYGAFTNGSTGVNFIDNDPVSLANVIIKMINSPNERHRMKEQVQKIAREQYNVDVMVDRFVSIAQYAIKNG